MDIEPLLFRAVEDALFSENSELVVSVHALLRYMQRSCNIDVALLKSECLFKWGYNKHKVPLKDGILLKYIEKTHPGVIDKARADLAYYCKGRTSSFEQDDMRFIIKENMLVTVYEL